jgi:hypothetical protein
MARQAALLLLAVHGYELPASSVTNDFYRQTLDLDLRSKQEFTAEILTAMGGISRMHFSRYKSLLKLSDEALELADRYNIEEGKLRHVITLSTQYHAELLRQIIDLNLTSKQVKEICEASGVDTEGSDDEDSTKSLSRTALQLAKLARGTTSTSAQDVARALLGQENNPDLARAYIHSLKRLLDEAEQHLLGQ